MRCSAAGFSEISEISEFPDYPDENWRFFDFGWGVFGNIERNGGFLRGRCGRKLACAVLDRAPRLVVTPRFWMKRRDGEIWRTQRFRIGEECRRASPPRERSRGSRFRESSPEQTRCARALRRGQRRPSPRPRRGRLGRSNFASSILGMARFVPPKGGTTYGKPRVHNG